MSGTSFAHLLWSHPCPLPQPWLWSARPDRTQCTIQCTNYAEDHKVPTKGVIDEEEFICLLADVRISRASDARS